MTDPNDPQPAGASVGGDAAQAKLANLKGLANAPKPERTYDAITVSVNKRFSKNWFDARVVHVFAPDRQLRGSATRPSGTTSRPTATTPTTRPTSTTTSAAPCPTIARTGAHVDGYYTHPSARGRSPSACRSRRARACRATTSRRWYFGQQHDHAAAARLGRPDADRRPQFNGRIVYRRALAPKVTWRRSSTCSTSSTSRRRC